MIDHEVSQEDVVRAVDIPINLRLATRTSKNFVSTQSMMNTAAVTTCLAGIFLRAQDDTAPRILARLMNEMLAKAVM